MERDITVTYPMMNRLYYTQMSFPRVLDECTRSNRFKKLFIVDDDSKDGSTKFVQDLLKRCPVEHKYIKKKIGNSIDSINYAVAGSTTKYYFKVDNDILIPEGAFDHMAWVMDSKAQLAFLMLIERQGLSELALGRSGIVTEREHIGGVGIFRGRVFEGKGWIGNDRVYWGWTKFQQTACQKDGWRAAQIEGSGMVLLDASPSYSRAREFKKAGLGRLIKGNEIYSVFEPQDNEDNET